MDYVTIENYSKSGDLHISRTIIEKIVSDATNSVIGAEILENKYKGKLLASLFGPIKVTFRRNGTVEVTIEISILKGANANDVSLKIQEEVSNALMAYTESVPFAVNIKIMEIK